jgi:hypothetical protein
MKAYLVTTGLAFGLLTAVHVWRYIEEGSGVADAFFVGVTLIAAGLCLWAVRLLRSLPRG